MKVESIEVFIQYNDNVNRHVIFDYMKDTHCPSCGQKGLWREEGEGDYYQGSSYLCIVCNSTHYLDNSLNNAIDYDLKSIEQIKKSISDE